MITPTCGLHRVPALLLILAIQGTVSIRSQAQDMSSLVARITESERLTDAEKAILTCVMRDLEPEAAKLALEWFGILDGGPLLSLQFRLSCYVEGELQSDVYVFGQRVLRKIPHHVPILIVVLGKDGRVRWWRHGERGVVTSVAIVAEGGGKSHLLVETTAVHRMGSPKMHKRYSMESGNVVMQ